MLLKSPLPNSHVTKVASLVRALCVLHHFCAKENGIFCTSEPADESNIFIEGEFTGFNSDPENMGIYYAPNIGHVSSERTNELLDRNYDRRNAAVPRIFTENDLPRTKMIQKVMDFGFIERLVWSVWDVFKN